VARAVLGVVEAGRQDLHQCRLGHDRPNTVLFGCDDDHFGAGGRLPLPVHGGLVQAEPPEANRLGFMVKRLCAVSI